MAHCKDPSSHDKELLPVRILEDIKHRQTSIDWDDRIGLQKLWNLKEKGWKVSVEWKSTPFGIGLFAAEDIAAGTVLRDGVLGRNLFQFRNVHEIEEFCRDSENEYNSRLRYISDYLWGFDPNSDERGYTVHTSFHDERFFGCWIPGNGLNHNPTPNTVYRPRRSASSSGGLVGITLNALCDVPRGQELYDDYRRHDHAPEWLREFSKAKNVILNFAECNDFVLPEEE